MITGETRNNDIHDVDGEFVGEPDRPIKPDPIRTLYAQRGGQWRVPPVCDKTMIQWYREVG